MSTLKVTVIVTIYNSEQRLRRCVDSILAQTYTNFELLLVDDGSTDGSGAICDEYATLNTRVRVFHKPNGGVSSARNIGLDNARGEWITFADADDYVYQNWLENYNFRELKDVDLIQQGAKSDNPIWQESKSVTMCGFDYYGNPQEYLHEVVAQQMVGYLWMKAFRYNIIREYNLYFDTKLTLQEDGVFVLNYLLYCAKIKAINKQGYYYFAPDWTKKYKQPNQVIIYLNKIQMECCERIFADDYTAYPVRFFKDSYINSLMVGFSKRPKLEYLKEIRNLHVKDYVCSRLFKPLKWLIVHDCTYIISWITLLVHSNLRLIVKKQV